MYDIYLLKLFVCFLNFVFPLVCFFYYFERGRFAGWPFFFLLLCVTRFGCMSWWFSFDFVFSTKISRWWHPCFHFFVFVLFIEYCLWCFRKTKTLSRWDALRARTKTLKLFNSYCIWLCVCLIYIYIIYFLFYLFVYNFLCFYFFFPFRHVMRFQFILVVSRKSTPNYLFEWEFDFCCFLCRRRKHELFCDFCFPGAHSSCIFFSPPENPGFLFVFNCDSIIHLSIFSLFMLQSIMNEA